MFSALAAFLEARPVAFAGAVEIEPVEKKLEVDFSIRPSSCNASWRAPLAIACPVDGKIFGPLSAAGGELGGP